MAKSLSVGSLVFVLTALFVLFFIAPPGVFSSKDTNGSCEIWVATVHDTINPMVSEYLNDLIDRAEKAGIRALIIELDTPGGLVDSTRHIVVRIMNSRIPIITYVSPRGARAASAGMFITIASHVAAMAPATNIGAAHPVSMGPMGPMMPEDEDESDDSTPADDVRSISVSGYLLQSQIVDEKIMNDLLAWSRGIAEEKNRNFEWVEQAIRKSISSTENEALEAGVIDIISFDIVDLTEKIDGRVVIVNSSELRLDLSNCRIVAKPMTWRQTFLSALINPTLAIYLLALGGLGLYFELSHPGFIIPGVVGGICLILGLFAMHTLPINTAGLLLILLSFVFFALEVRMPSYGVLTIGGITSFVLGSAMLVDSDLTGMRVSLQAIIPLAFAVAIITIILVALIVSTHKSKVTTGDSGLIGKKGKVTRQLSPEGQVYVHGEIWRARSSDGTDIPESTEVIVTDLSGLTITVEPTEPVTGKE
jgi:membrane-bound serine protease (ClpP class)